jgi:hypothetical protein
LQYTPLHKVLGINPNNKPQLIGFAEMDRVDGYIVVQINGLPPLYIQEVPEKVAGSA